jgi:hypothetical protein
MSLYACAGAIIEPQGGILWLSKRIALNEPRYNCWTTIMKKRNKGFLVSEVQLRHCLWREDDVNLIRKDVTNKLWEKLLQRVV